MAKNGLHMHLLKGRKPLFYDENGYSQLNEVAIYFIGGRLIHTRDLCALANLSIRLYKRLVSEHGALGTNRLCNI